MRLQKIGDDQKTDNTITSVLRADYSDINEPGHSDICGLGWRFKIDEFNGTAYASGDKFYGFYLDLMKLSGKLKVSAILKKEVDGTDWLMERPPTVYSFPGPQPMLVCQNTSGWDTYPIFIYHVTYFHKATSSPVPIHNTQGRPTNVPLYPIPTAPIYATPSTLLVNFQQDVFDMIASFTKNPIFVHIVTEITKDAIARRNLNEAPQ